MGASAAGAIAASAASGTNGGRISGPGAPSTAGAFGSANVEIPSDVICGGDENREGRGRRE